MKTPITFMDNFEHTLGSLKKGNNLKSIVYKII